MSKQIHLRELALEAEVKSLREALVVEQYKSAALEALLIKVNVYLKALRHMLIQLQEKADDDTAK